MKYYILALVLLLSHQCLALNLVINGLDLKNSKGIYRCLLFNKEQGFPSNPGSAIKQFNGPINNNKGVCIFENIPSGTYAVSSFQDENSNSKLDTNMLGIPKEKYGFSNNASRPFGPPKFEEASFTLNKDKAININLK